MQEPLESQSLAAQPATQSTTQIFGNSFDSQADAQATNQMAVQPETLKSGWINNIEIVSVVISLGGTVASIVTSNLAFAAVPLSLTTAIGLANRRRLMDMMAQSQQRMATQLVIQDQQQQQTIAQQAQMVQTEFEAVKLELAKLHETHEEFSQQLQGLDTKGANIETMLEKLREIDRCTQAIRTNPKAAELFFQRGQVRQSLMRMEDVRLAIEDYTQAVELEPGLAKAYFHRGILRSEVGEKRQAGEDLRMAAKCYFDQGDMDNYAEAKRLSEQIYEKFESRQPEVSEEGLLAANLFA